MKYNGIELIKHLSLAFGPTGREDVVRELIIEQIEGDCDGYCEDRVGNLIAKVCGRGLDYHPEKPQRLMLSAHMDEVGFMIRQITDEGYLKFGTLGGIDPRVLCGRGVTIYGKPGTAEIGPRTKRRNITHFIAFADFQDKTYALALTIEDGHSGGRTCAPIAAEFFRQFLLN